jgi:hypothetical protein
MLMRKAGLVEHDHAVDQLRAAWIVASQELIGGQPLNDGAHGAKGTPA